MNDTTHEAVVYAQVQATFSRWDKDRVDSLKVVKMTQSKPTRLEANSVVVKLRLQLPDTAFQPFSPSAIITVPESMVDKPTVVIAEDPS